MLTSNQAPRFDPQLWLSAFAEIGGGYALVADRRLTFLVEALEIDVVGHRAAQRADAATKTHAEHLLLAGLLA